MSKSEEKETTTSNLFDQIYNDFRTIVDDTESTNSPKGQEGIKKTINALEALTIHVSMLDLFSRNENYNEVNPLNLKFLLLPYMLGSLWQLNTKEQRKRICGLSRIYFKDFLKRCVDYELWDGEVPADKEEEDGGGGGDEAKKEERRKLSPDEKRQKKVQRFKENKELDVKIQALRKYMEKGEDEAEPYIKDIYVALIKRAINDTQDQLDSIEQENELIKFQEQRGSTSPTTLPPPSPQKPLKPFIITRDATQKTVFGLGYPSLPVMTVEELYQQRRQTGEWGPPPTGGVQHKNPEEEAEREARQKDELEEADDEAELERKRQFDEYKDDHRRGWGNRFNRS